MAERRWRGSESFGTMQPAAAGREGSGEGDGEQTVTLDHGAGMYVVR